MLLIPITTAAENTGIFAILDEKFINNISELPYLAGTPDKNLQSSNDIHGWIDITGFRGMIRDNGIDYTYDLPERAAIVQYEASGNPPGYVDDISKKLRVYQKGNYTIAVLDVVMKWSKVFCDKNGCWTVSYRNTASFQDSEVSPKIYTPISDSFKVNLIQFNTSAFENIDILISTPVGLTNVKIEYGNKNASHQLAFAHVEQTVKGVYFANISHVDIWETQGQGIGRMGGRIILDGNLSKMNLSALKITGSNLYESITADTNKFNLSREEFTPEKDVQNPVLLFFIGTLLTFIFALNYFVKNIIGGT
jgi:hypothetical protein